MRTVPVHLYTAADGRQIRFAVDSDFWLTDLSGEDGLDLDISEQQSSGQTGTTVTPDRINFINEQQAGSIFLRLCKHITHA